MTSPSVYSVQAQIGVAPKYIDFLVPETISVFTDTQKSFHAKLNKSCVRMTAKVCLLDKCGVEPFTSKLGI